MKIAIVGSGAAAAGILLGLERWGPPTTDVTIFDPGECIDIPVGAARADGPDEEYTRALYHRLHADHGYAMPPPKTRFGHTMSKLDVDGQPRFSSSPHRGGLTNFWGGGMSPFTDRELVGWPLSAAELDPYYRLVAGAVGITGERDALDEYYGRSYVNRPPLASSPVMASLARSITAGAPLDAGHPYRLLTGASRLAVETRSNHERACVYNGQCMLGCVRRAIWSAAHEIERHRRGNLITGFVAGHVRAFVDRRVIYTPRGCAARSGGEPPTESAGPFDRVFIAAGCISSTEIVMRSLGLSHGPVLQDNAALWFPILFLGRGRREPDAGIDSRRYFALCNLSILAVPNDPGASVVPLGIYPSAEHIWRYLAPEPLWPILRAATDSTRWRLLLGRAYLGDDANSSFTMELDNDVMTIRSLRVPNIDDRMDALGRTLRAALAGSKFYVPPMKPRRHGTANHYAGTLPYGGALVHVPRDGAIAPGVHLADSAVFPSSPAIHPTFTIMANACRTARESLEAR
jgi:hypothetical protein